MSLTSSPAIIERRLPGPARWLLLAPVLAVALGGWFSIRWFTGSVIAEVASTSETPDLSLARMAARWAPGDPFVHWRLGELTQRDFTAANIHEAVREYQAAVARSPNDFRFWTELGRALESAGDRPAAEAALQRAVELAPNYYHPRWTYGNVLLRSGNNAEAFPHLFRAAEAHEPLWPQVLNLAWQAYDGDVDRIANEACKEPKVRAVFAVYLIGVKRSDDALRLWQTMSGDDRRRAMEGARHLRKAFLEAGQFRAAFEVDRDIEADRNGVPVTESVSNGGFEEPITLPVSQSFGWTLGSNVQSKLSIGTQPHSGRRSLQIVLSATNKLDRINASQLIVVEPNTQYRLECYARTEQLSSASTPIVLVVDAGSQSALAYSTPLPTGTNDWQRIALDFKTQKSDGIIVMISRLPCAVGQVCPIFGTVWYDDFNLQRGSSGAVRNNHAASRKGSRAAPGKA
jgi:tetratricopeptide repeat protein/carbohydrate binding protein with CBM4/9 domain